LISSNEAEPLEQKPVRIVAAPILAMLIQIVRIAGSVRMVQHESAPIPFEKARPVRAFFA
jgi:hypothetical protein